MKRNEMPYLVIVHDEEGKSKVAVFCEEPEQATDVIRQEKNKGNHDISVWKNLLYCPEDYVEEA